VQGLGGLGADAKDALPVVMGLLNDPDARVRSQAQLALKQIEK
jgi:HEAT repeat protein